jgi:hypothetical protein
VKAEAGQSASGTPLLELLVFALTTLALLAAMAYAMLTRQPWYDEFYTMYVTQPKFSWHDAFANHWLTDNHPPWYYALVRAVGGLGNSIEAHRFVNLLIAMVTVGGASLALGARHRLLAIAFLLYLSGLGAVFPFVAELRSYFLSLCSVSLLLLVLVVIRLEEGPPTRRHIILFSAATLVAFNVHIVTSIIAGAVVLPFIADALWQRDYLRFKALCIPALVAGMLFVGTVAVQFPLWIANTQSFWIPAGSGQALGAIVLVAQYAVAGNAIVVLAGLVGTGLLLRALRARSASPYLKSVFLIAAGMALACCLILAIQSWRPFVIPKYMIGLFPCIGMICAIGYHALASTLSRLTGAALLLAAALITLLNLGQNAKGIAGQTSWDETAKIIAQQVARCPGTIVHIDPHWNRVLAALQPSDNARVVDYAYQQTAQRNHFRIEPLSSHRISGDCPTIFWGVNAGMPQPNIAEITAHTLSRGFSVDRLDFYQFGSGWLATTRPISVSEPNLVPNDDRSSTQDIRPPSKPAAH